MAQMTTEEALAAMAVAIGNLADATAKMAEASAEQVKTTTAMVTRIDAIEQHLRGGMAATRVAARSIREQIAGRDEALASVRRAMAIPGKEG